MKQNFEWLNNKDIKELIKVLSYEYHEFYFVGGCIRDSLLNLEIKDFDIASNFTPQKNMDELKNCPYTIIPSGLKYGTISININNNIFNITTLRKDIKSYGRDCDVEFSSDLYEDAKRRDFTINALYLNPKNGELIDFFNSIDDIKHRKLIFIGEAKDRIKEDYLRILRYFRFYNNLELNNPPQNNLIEDFKSLANNLNTLSTQRIHNEFIKIINTLNCYKTLYYMEQSQILQYILPTKLPNIEAIAHLSKYNLNENIKENLILDNGLINHMTIILSTLLPSAMDIKQLKLNFSDKYLENLKQILMLRDFIILHNILDYNELAQLAINYKFEQVIIAIMVSGALIANKLHIYADMINLLFKKNQLKLPINGNDLLNLNIAPTNIKMLLNKLTFYFWNNPHLNKEQLLEKIKENNL
jgi:poly(A) polymerase